MKYLTTKEFAKLHNVNTRTLHYYDNINLFSPKYKGENGYRYYTYMQGEEFQMIMALRELSMSIAEIKNIIEKRNADYLENMLEKKALEIDDKIRQLKQIKRVLNDKSAMLKTARTKDLDEISLISCKTEYLFLTKIGNEVLDKELMDKINSLSKNNDINRIYNADYGAMISVDSLFKEDYNAYNYYFIKIKNSKQKKGLHKTEKGLYLRAYHVGEWKRLPETYKRIINYARANNLNLSGYSYEQGLNDMAIKDLKDSITEILIKCS